MYFDEEIGKDFDEEFGKEIEKSLYCLQVKYFGNKTRFIGFSQKKNSLLGDVESNDSNPLRQDIAYFLVRKLKSFTFNMRQGN